MYGALLALALLAAPAAASPFPQQDPDEAEEELLEVPDEPRPAPTHVHRSLPDMAIVPSFGVGGFLTKDAADHSFGGTHFWGGVLLHPAPNELGPFMGIGVSLDGRGNEDAWYGTLEMRYGVAWLVNPRKYESAVFPGFTAYAIGGWRPERGSGGLYRAGGGIASPMLFAVTASELCVPLPSMVEFVVDAPDGKFSGDETESTLRVGWQF